MSSFLVDILTINTEVCTCEGFAIKTHTFKQNSFLVPNPVIIGTFDDPKLCGKMSFNPSEDERYMPTRGTRYTLDMVDNYGIIDLISASPTGYFRLCVEQDGVTCFEGPISAEWTDCATQCCGDVPVRIEAIDDITHAGNMPNNVVDTLPDDPNYFPVPGTIVEHVGFWMAVASRLYDPSCFEYCTRPAIFNSTIVEDWIGNSAGLWMDRGPAGLKNLGGTYRDLIDTLLGSFKLSMYYREGCYHITQLGAKEIGTATINKYDGNGLFLGTVPVPATKIIDPCLEKVKSIQCSTKGGGFDCATNRSLIGLQGTYLDIEVANGGFEDWVGPIPNNWGVNWGPDMIQGLATWPGSSGAFTLVWTNGINTHPPPNYIETTPAVALFPYDIPFAPPAAWRYDKTVRGRLVVRFNWSAGDFSGPFDNTNTYDLRVEIVDNLGRSLSDTGEWVVGLPVRQIIKSISVDPGQQLNGECAFASEIFTTDQDFTFTFRLYQIERYRSGDNVAFAVDNVRGRFVLEEPMQCDRTRTKTDIDPGVPVVNPDCLISESCYINGQVATLPFGGVFHNMGDLFADGWGYSHAVAGTFDLEEILADVCLRANCEPYRSFDINAACPCVGNKQMQPIDVIRGMDTASGCATFINSKDGELCEKMRVDEASWLDL